MKKIFFTCSFLISTIIICGQYIIPTNSSSKTQLSNFLVAKLSNVDDEQINYIVKNTENYLRSISPKNIKELNLSNFQIPGEGEATAKISHVSQLSYVLLPSKMNGNILSD